MEFIEKIFGVSPDGGSGAFELILLLIPIAGFCLFYFLRERSLLRRSSKRGH